MGKRSEGQWWNPVVYRSLYSGGDGVSLTPRDIFTVLSDLGVFNRMELTPNHALEPADNHLFMPLQLIFDEGTKEAVNGSVGAWRVCQRNEAVSTVCTFDYEQVA